MSSPDGGLFLFDSTKTEEIRVVPVTWSVTKWEGRDGLLSTFGLDCRTFAVNPATFGANPRTFKVNPSTFLGNRSTTNKMETTNSF